MKLIHFQIPTTDNRMVLPYAEIANLATITKNILPPNIECIFSPFNITWNNEIAEIDGVNGLELSEDSKDKFLDLTDKEFKECGIEYKILDID